jgi:ketosteroid isomerase-like protein
VKLRSAAAIGLMIVAASGCASHAVRLAPTDSEASVRDARRRWNATLAARDSSALARLVEDSAVHVTVRFTHVGKPAFLAQFLSAMSARPQFQLTYRSERVNLCERPSCEMATEYGTWNETWLENGEPTEVSGTYYAIWRLHNDAWQIHSESFATTKCRGRRYCGR